MSIETEIKAEAIRIGMPLNELAKRMCTSQSNLSRSFSGKRTMRTSEVIKASKALGTPVWELWKRASEEETEEKITA